MADKRNKNREVREERTRISDTSERKRDRSRSVSEDEETKKEKKPSKQKSRKRSHSDYESSASSSKSSDSEKRKSEKKIKKRKKKRSSSSESSLSESDEDDRPKSRHKQHKRKKKKDKKVKKKKKKEKKIKHGTVDQNKYGAYGIIRESDMFVKQQEFYAWMQEVKNINPETLPKFETRKMFEDFMEDYNTATMPHKKYYDLEKWEAKRLQKNELKALKKARETSFSIADDEKRHDSLHRRAAGSKHAGPSRQQLLEMQQELRRRQDEEYRKKAGLA